MHITKNLLYFTLICLLLQSVYSEAKGEKTGDVTFVKRESSGYTFSINADGVRLDKILNELVEKCSIKVVINDKEIASHPVSIKFRDLSIEQGVKRIVKSANITNYLIKYAENGTVDSEVVEVIILGNMKTDNNGKDEFSQKIEAFKEQYEWENDEVQEVAGHLLKLMPNEAKNEPGLEILQEALDLKVHDAGKRVSERMFLDAIKSIVPPSVAPAMINLIEKCVQKFKDEKYMTLNY